ncbi:MAG TPA: diacylglycerol kinase [Planctomycetaceae bacterium]|nr:diacylglycerol kinase [Planctomycetaceae bacterium]
MNALHIRPDAPSDWTSIVAMDRCGVIGRDGDLPWRLSSDLKRFKDLTMGHCLLMGRKTYQSIGRPLPGRQTIVLSRQGLTRQHPEVIVVDRLDQVASHVQPDRLVMVVGGAQIYRDALSRCGQLWITRVQADVGGDTYFPDVDWHNWRLMSRESISAGPKDQWPTEFEKWSRC